MLPIFYIIELETTKQKSVLALHAANIITFLFSRKVSQFFNYLRFVGEMGNTTSDVNDSLKAQADSENGPEIYKLVNVAGGGELARLMKIAVKTKDYTDVDNCIRNDVAKYLYNEGKGETVSNFSLSLSFT